MTIGILALSILAIAAALSAIMAAAWVVQRSTGNSGWVDTTWTFGLGIVGSGAALMLPPHDFPPREMAVAVLIALWAARLGIHIAARTAKITDDPRYAKLAEGWGGDAPRRIPYRYETSDKADWIAQYFFTGGIMPSHNLARHFADLFTVEQDWLWDGTHYERTALDWLANFDTRRDQIMPVLSRAYGNDAALWAKRWRIFFLATAGMFGHAQGKEWGVSHYRMKAAG